MDEDAVKEIMELVYRYADLFERQDQLNGREYLNVEKQICDVERNIIELLRLKRIYKGN